MIPKKFNFSYGELLQRGDRIIALLQRDSKKFSVLGYEGDFKENLETKVKLFRTLLPDAYWMGQQMLKTHDKNNSRRELCNNLSELRFRAKLALGEKSVKYASFGFSRLADLDELQLIIYSWHVEKTAKEMLEELSVRRIDEDFLEELRKSTNNLDEAIDEQKKAIATREEKVFERRSVANELYSTLSECCDVGKRIWDDINPAFYDDYVIYGSQDSINEDDVPEGEGPDSDSEK